MRVISRDFQKQRRLLDFKLTNILTLEQVRRFLVRRISRHLVPDIRLFLSLQLGYCTTAAAPLAILCILHRTASVPCMKHNGTDENGF
jgi:hypothetical protein